MNEKYYQTLSIGKVFLKCVIPSMWSMIFSSLYTIIDGYFIGNYIGIEGLASINIAMPFLMISFAMADMIAIGSSVKISFFLGEKNFKLANEIFSASIILVFSLSAIFGSVSYIFALNIHHIIKDDVLLATGVAEYLKVFGFFSVGFIPLMAVDNYLRICGKVKLSMYINIITSVLNIILDYLFIKVLGFGIGAAAATSGISTSVGTIFALVVFASKKVTLNFVKPKISFKMLLQIIYNGSSDFFGKIAGSVVAVSVNYLLLKLGNAIAVSAYGIVMYVDSFLCSILYGMIDSLQPPITYNLGAKENSRVKSIFKITMKVGFISSIFFMILFMASPSFWIKIFAKKASIDAINLGKTALLLFAPSYIFMWFNVLVSSFLTFLDKAKESLVLTMLSSVVFPMILIFILPSVFKLNGVFLIQLFSQALTFLFSFIFWKKKIKNI